MMNMLNIGLRSPTGVKMDSTNAFMLPPRLPWENEYEDRDENQAHPESPPWSHANGEDLLSDDVDVGDGVDDGEEIKSGARKVGVAVKRLPQQRRLQRVLNDREKKNDDDDDYSKVNKDVLRVITGTQPVRRRSPRNVERKTYDYNRNVDSKRLQTDSRERSEACAMNAEVRTRKTRLFQSNNNISVSRIANTTNENDYGPIITTEDGSFKRRRQEDETRWTLAENKQYKITGTQPSKPSREFLEKSRATVSAKRNSKQVTSTRKYYGFGSTFTLPPAQTKRTRRNVDGDDIEEEEDYDDDEFQRWPPKTTVTNAPVLHTLSRAKGRAAMEAAKNEANMRRKNNTSIRIFNKPVSGFARKPAAALVIHPSADGNDSSWEQEQENIFEDVYEFTPPPPLVSGAGAYRKAAKTPKSNAQKLGAMTQPEPFLLATEKRAIINRRQFLKDQKAEVERETYVLSNKKATSTRKRVVAKTPSKKTSQTLTLTHYSSDAAKTPRIQKSTGLNKVMKKGPIRGSRAEDRAVFSELDENAVMLATTSKKNLLKSALKGTNGGRKGRAQGVTVNKN
jgi:hypothetical protein